MRVLLRHISVCLFVCFLFSFVCLLCLCLRRGYLGCPSLPVGWAAASGVWCIGVSWKMLRIQPDDQSLCFGGCPAAQHFPKVTPRMELFCCTRHFCSAIVSLCSEEALRVAQPLCAVCNVLVSVRAATQGHCALGMILSLGSFLGVFLVMTCVFWHAPSWTKPWP